MSIDDLYQPVILDHYRHPSCRRKLGPTAVRRERRNLYCGDEVEVEASIVDGRLCVSAHARGCVINHASTSILASAVDSTTIAGARQFDALFRAQLAGEANSAPGALGDAAALLAVRQYPTRIGCAVLSWDALMEALDAVVESEQPVCP